MPTTPLQAETLRVEELPDGIVCLWLDVPGRTQNVFGRQLLVDLDRALDHVAAQSGVRVLLVRSAKPAGFVAGADLHELGAVQTAAEATAISARGQELFHKLAALPVPSIAVVNGPCLGGGLELALACDYRLAIEEPGTQFGLPEVNLGLLPGWGGTQRLPRIVGLERALQIILVGRQLGAAEALRWKLADAMAPRDAEALGPALGRLILRAVTEGKRPRTSLPLHTLRQRVLESNALGRSLLFRGAEGILKKRVPEDMPAPGEALQAVRIGLRQGLDAGLSHEREAAGRLAVSSACRHLVNLFFQREKARKLPEDVRKQATEKVRKIGIIGAGAMGAGIAQLAALRGYEVVIREANADALGAGVLRLQSLFQKAVQRRVLSAADAEKKLKAIRGTLAWDGFADADLVVEAAVEDLEVKRALFRELDRVTRSGAVLATNTSSLSIAAIAEGLTHKHRVAGCHFFNPVHKLPLVEVVRGPESSDHCINLLLAWSVALGKTPVVVRDGPGFVVNRVLTPYLNEAVLLVAEGLDVVEVDRLMHRFGMASGPLETLDQVGLDVAAHAGKTIQPRFADRWPPNPALEWMCERGWLGQKNGWGFYRYAGQKPRVNKAAVQLLREADLPGRSTRKAKLSRDAELALARTRLVLLSVNEAAACLAEGLAADLETIDLAMVLGTVWAPHRGGPLHYALDRGIDQVAARLSDLSRELGPRFQPHPQLTDLRPRER